MYTVIKIVLLYLHFIFITMKLIIHNTRYENNNKLLDNFITNKESIKLSGS